MKVNVNDWNYARRIERAMLWAEEAARPWACQIARVRSLERPTYQLTADGLRMISDGLSDRDREMIRQCEEAINTIYEQARQMVDAPMWTGPS